MKILSRKQKIVVFRIILSSISLLVLNIIDLTGYLKLSLYLAPYFLISYDILYKSMLGIIRGRVLDENFLMAIASIGAFTLGCLTQSFDFNEGILVILLYQIGELFQSIAVKKSKNSVLSLMDIRKDSVNVLMDGEIKRVSPEDIEVGSVIIIFPGERVLIDGIIIEGEASVDTSSLTGESIPRDLGKNDEIFSGSINLNGKIKVQTTRSFGSSTASKILDLIENASNKKSKSEKFITKFSKIYTPIVCVLALVIAVVPPIFDTLLLNQTSNYLSWIYRSLTFLVISCPCALVISVPLSFFAGIGGLSRRGILVKGASHIEILARVRHVVFDKTGTLTKGKFEVSKIVTFGISEEKLLEYATKAESFSLHPVSKSLKNAYTGTIDTELILDQKEFSGLGVSATVDGEKVLVGNKKLMEKFNVEYSPCANPHTVLYVAINYEYKGYIIIEDSIKSSSYSIVDRLKDVGIYNTYMLSGDIDVVAKSVKEKTKIDKYKSGLLPNQKVECLEEIICGANLKEKVMFIGDGINDAPVLMRADIGVAMGGVGSEIALESSDMVIMDDDLNKVVTAIKGSKKCVRIVKQNIIFSLLVKLICLTLGGVGVLSLGLSIFADVGVMVFAVLNSIRTFY